MGFRTRTTMDAKRAYCPGASGNLTKQCLIQDHMFAHYRKVFTAKAAVDTSAPKSMQSSVKYTDRKRRERLKREASQRSLSSRSLKSQLEDTRGSCSLKASRTSLQAEEDGCHYLGGSVASSPRLNTSFNVREIVYVPQRAAMAGSSYNCYRSTSEFSYREPSPQRQPTHRSCGIASSQSAFKAFQDPVQKTYSGDLMLKHSKQFTPEKPFTPRTLRKDSKSYLSQYRFYTPPRRKPPEEQTTPRLVQQDSSHGSSQAKELSATEWGLPQTFDLETELPDEETSRYGKHSKGDKTAGGGFLSFSRMSPDGTRSPIMRKVNAEEEELVYLEFIADVTNEILMLGLYSDRVLKRVFQRHIDMNKHRLDEDKMRHLLEILHHDIQSPSNSSTFCVHPTKKEKDSFLQDYPNFSPDITSKDKLVNRHSPSTMFDREPEALGKVSPLFVSTPLQRSPSNISYSLGGEAEDGPLKLGPTSYSSPVLDRETEDGPLQRSPPIYRSHVQDEEAEDGPLKCSPISYSSHDLDGETEDAQENQEIVEYHVSPVPEHNHLTSEENEPVQYAEDNNELSGEVEELGLNMESLHVSQTPSKTIEDEQDFSIFSDDEF